MGECQFNKDDWKCSLDAEKGNDYCYWHQEIKGKNPTLEKLEELKSKNISYVFLQEANLERANLQKANLEEANLQEAKLMEANLQEAELSGANLQEAKLMRANLQKAALYDANLQKAQLYEANLQKAALCDANLQEADLVGANLQKANLMMANLQKAALYDANLQKAQLYETNLRKADLQSAIFTGSNMQATLFDTESRLDGSNLKNANLNESFIDYAKSLRNATIFEEENLNEKEVNEQKADEANDYEDKRHYYLASQEVYNKLYHFYSDEGMDYRAKHAHYRRAEVRRKLLRVRNKWNSIKGISDRIKWGLDWVFLKTLTGYGDSIIKPVAISVFSIFAFGLGFFLLKGVQVEARSVQLLDYFYLSLTTFTGLGFANVQPDITVPLMQPLIMVESAVGVTMIALIIFVVTYQISR
jgi:uncharacterized protein YjbI with pentapeptide repeats